MGHTTITSDVFKERVRVIRQNLNKEKIKGLLIFNDEFRPYYSMYISDYKPVENLEVSPQGVYISQDALIVFLGSENLKSARQESWIEDIRDIKELTPFFLDMPPKTCLGLCGIEKIPHFYKKMLDRVVAHIDFVNKDGMLDELRAMKHPDEVVRLEQAAHVADDTIRAMIAQVNAGYTTEVDLAAFGEFYIRRQGMDIGYDTIVASGKNTVDKTWRPASKVIDQGDLLIMNMVPRYQGYCSFLTVTHAVDNPHAQEVCNRAKDVITYMAAHIKVGDPVTKIYDLYYKKTEEYGLLDHFFPFNSSEKSLGHSTGLEVVERPYLHPQSSLVLQKNMVLSLKYNLYNFEFGDVRFEFNLWMGDKAKILNQCLLD